MKKLEKLGKIGEQNLEKIGKSKKKVEKIEIFDENQAKNGLKLDLKSLKGQKWTTIIVAKKLFSSKMSKILLQS